MSINTITPAVLEIAPALANINFNFSLWKVEAPKEFDGVGSALSTARRDKAENGLPHATAQKLGALFETLVPPTPNLLRAYGQRASEISQVDSLTPAARKAYGAFSGHAGSDATSIWAAATSGRPAAIAAHLLACFLARVWDGPEAVSIWVELVRRRKEIIVAEFTGTSLVELAAMEAAKQEITRAQIAEWDASARSWLRTADNVKSRQNKQLTLIVDKLETSVNRISDTYDSVMAAWNNSLNQMEGLIEGIAQQAQRGDIIVAISAWHLYPDMRVVVPSVAHVSQRDPIFASGGILTIGLEMRDSQQNGVSWSLPLACLRYYGDPVMKSCSVNSNERSRLTLEELVLSIAGCLIVGWPIPEYDTSRAIKWLAQLADILDNAVNVGSREATAMIKGLAASSWFSLLLSAARKYQRSSDDERQTSRKLIFLGRRHGKAFLGLPDHALFGLTYRGRFVGMMKSEDEQIQFLREVAKEVQTTAGLENHHMVIRYKHRCQYSSTSYYEYATALPLLRKSTKRDANEHYHQSRDHCRWLYAGEKPPQYDVSDERYCKRLQESTGNAEKRYVADSFFRGPRMVSMEEYCNIADPNTVEHVQQDFQNRARVVTASGELVYRRDYEYIQDIFALSEGVFWPSMYETNAELRNSDASREPFYKMVYGDVDSAALFAFEGRSTLIDLAHPPAEDTLRVFTLFEEEKVDHGVVVRQLLKYFQMGNPKGDPYLQSAKAVSTAAILYKNFACATVDVRVLQRRLYQSRWLIAARGNPKNFGMMVAPGETPASLLPYELDRACAFACIAMFESGVYDPSPNELTRVIAMSAGDSIYTSTALLCGPCESSYSHTIARVRGNVGRPGIAYLVPPQDPLITKVAISEWSNISRETFDGRIKDSFPTTSLHLSFTGAQSPVSLEFSGAQDNNVYILETLISVFDKGRWIADLDPLKTFSSHRLHLIPPCDDGREDKDNSAIHEHHHHNKTGHSPPQCMMSIDNWLELVDTPESHYAIVQTHRNWEARLAAASISVALGLQTFVLPSSSPPSSSSSSRDTCCWACFDRTVASVAQDQPRIQNIVIS